MFVFMITFGNFSVISWLTDYLGMGGGEEIPFRYIRCVSGNINTWDKLRWASVHEPTSVMCRLVFRSLRQPNYSHTFGRWDRRGRDRILLGFTTTYASSVSSNPAHGEVCSLQHYVVNFVSDLREVGGFLWVFLFSPPIKITGTI